MPEPGGPGARRDGSDGLLTGGRPPELLACVAVGCGYLAVGACPDALDVPAGAHKQGSRSQRYESHEQGVLNEVLPLLRLPEIPQKHHACSYRCGCPVQNLVYSKRELLQSEEISNVHVTPYVG